MKKLYLCVACVLLTAMGLTACSNPTPPKQTIDPDKTQIMFSLWEGGFGDEWAFEAAEEYNKTDPDFQILIDPNKDEWYSVQAAFEAGTTKHDIYLNKPDLKEGASKGWFEDLADVYASNPDGENSQTLAEKIRDKDKDYYEKVYRDGDKYYGIPFMDGFSGFVYDHEIFLDNKFLIGTDGMPITSSSQKLSAGRDGKEGTFDDGHPKNMTEYILMTDKIKKVMPLYLWSNQFQYYTLPLYHSILAEYEGADNYFLNYTLNGKYKTPGSSTPEQTITPDKGYEVFNMKGRQVALNFFYDYLTAPGYYHPDSIKDGVSHTDAQKSYVYGSAYPGMGGTQQAAFLYEGIWWEKEAEGNFNTLYQNGEVEYKYGTRDYRMMMLPLFGDQQENGYFLGNFDAQSIFVKKQTDPKQLEAIKKFLTLLHSDKYLKLFNTTSGCVRPFEYELSTEELSKLTKFAQNNYKLYNDPNVNFLRTDLNRFISNTAYHAASTGALKVEMTKTWFGSKQYHYPSEVFLRGEGITQIGTAEQYGANAFAFYSDNWKDVEIV